MSIEGLRDYQREGVSFLAERASALLADEMGLGKTVQAVIAIQQVLAVTGGRALVVAPSSLKLNWLRELRHWAPGLAAQIVQGSAADRDAYYTLPVPVLVTSYENLRADAPRFRSDLVFEVSVLDEAQRIKNPDSSTALGARLIPRRRAWALTGTPVENAPEDLHAIFGYVRAGTIESGMTTKETLGAISGFVLRRRKADVLGELPPIIEQEVPLELEGSQLQGYKELWGARKSVTGEGSGWASNALALLTKLKQACNYDEATGESVKLSAVELICDGLEADGKLIVFSQYVHTLDFIAARLRMPVLLYHGGMDEATRDENLARFRRAVGPVVLLMSLRAGAVGLNLQEASAVVIFDRWWNPSVEEQAVHRAHRFGRETPLHVFRFVVEDSVEKRIEAILDRKSAVFAEYVEDPAWAGHEPAVQDLREVLR